MKDDLEKILIDENEENGDSRDSDFYENEIKEFMLVHEGEQISNDIQLLRDMGYDNKMINKVYILLHPETIDRAIDYMTEIDGIIQHDFFENHYKLKDRNLCFICGKTKRYHLDYIPEEFLEDNNFDFNFNDDDDNNININVNNDIKEKKEVFMCNICYEDLLEEEKEYNSLPCKHFCCTQCWINYLKTSITEAKVEKIKCIEHKCPQIIPEEFILKHIENDPKIVEKYQKFKKRAEIINDPNKKQCPHPDCDSFLEKPKSNKKYVQCQNGHEFCFNCLRPPHGRKTCEQILEKDFQIWSKDKVIKKCPKCKIYTEKNEGCNHMTCTSCKYQWCWLCEGMYSYNHYSQGQCNGHQFTKANYISEVKKKPEPKKNSLINRNINNRPHYNRDINLLPSRRRKRNYFEDDEEQTNCCCSLSTVFFTCFHKINYIEVDIDGNERFMALIIWFFGYFLFFAYQHYNSHEDITLYMNEMPSNIYRLIGYVISFLFFICYQIAFTIIITPFIIVCMFYPFFVYKIKMFFSIGKANYFKYNFLVRQRRANK